MIDNGLDKYRPKYKPGMVYHYFPNGIPGLSREEQIELNRVAFDLNRRAFRNNQKTWSWMKRNEDLPIAVKARPPGQKVELWRPIKYEFWTWRTCLGTPSIERLEAAMLRYLIGVAS